MRKQWLLIGLSPHCILRLTMLFKGSQTLEATNDMAFSFGTYWVGRGVPWAK